MAVEAMYARIKSLVNEYAKSTQFHGFAIMSDVSLPLKFIWGILIAFAFGLAARDFGQLVDFYKSEPTTLSVSVESNTNFFIPNPTLCMETSLPFPYDKNRNGDGYIGKQSYYGDMVSDIDSLLLATDNLTTWYKMDSAWPTYRLLYYYSYTLVSYWTDAEMLLVGQQQSYHRKLFTDWSIQGPLTAATIQVLYEALKSRNVSVAQLKRFVASRLCSDMLPLKLKYGSKLSDSVGYTTQHDAPQQYDGCSLDLLTHQSFSLVCIKLFDENNIVQLNQSNGMSIAFENIIPWDNYGNLHYYYWLNLMTHSGADYTDLATSLNRSVFPPPTISSMSDPDNTWANYRFYLDLKGRSTLPQLSSDSVISWNPLENKFVRVSIISEFQYYNSKAQPCATETKYECEWRQRIEQIHQKCGCWPSSLIFAANSTLHPRCEVDLSAAKNGIAAVGHCKGHLNFSLNCPRECQLLSYEKGSQESSYWEIPPFRYPRYNLVPSGYFELFLETSNQRLVITESLYKDWTTFAAEFGGSIGTWLGR